MKTIKINLSHTNYDIVLGDNALSFLPKLMKDKELIGKTVIITDSNVAPLYLDKLKKILGDEGILCEEIIINAGEEYKTLDTVAFIYDKLSEYRVTRKDIILAFGGGVTGDISGFCAATYLRGIRYIQVPTTLLSMVDSSIGGKTGVDLKSGKNLIGAFKQPSLVLADFSLLESLENEQFASGMAEIIKAAFIRDRVLLEKLVSSNDIKKDIEEFIIRAINVKKEIVELDEFEKYERMLLNFGHTFGHAIEKYYDFKGITHGQAVAIGMCLVTKDEDVKSILCKVLGKYGLETKTDVPMKTILELCTNDKKALKDSINIVAVNEPGFAQIINVSFDELGELYG